MLRKIIALAALVIMALALPACRVILESPVSSTPDDNDRINTAAAKTVAALGTEIAQGRNPQVETLMNFTATFTNTPTGTRTPKVTSTPKASACENKAEFVEDVTIQDGSTLLPNSKFTKTWRLKNAGSCTWTPSYAVVFAKRGMSLDGPASTPLLKSGEVKPGETVKASVALRAPNDPGDYEGYWMLRSKDDHLFGTGANGATPFFVKIHVGDTFSFAEQVCSAEWSSGAGDPLPCPGESGDQRGYVLPVKNPKMEDNQDREGPGFVTMPEPVAGGYIVGKFSGVMVPEHTDFRATLSCAPEAKSCYVRFKVEYQINNGEKQVLGEWNEGNEGGVTEAVKDLDAAAGQLTTFTFTLYVSGEPDQSKGIWFNPRIIPN